MSTPASQTHESLVLDEHRPQDRRVALATLVGTSIEWYDYFIYANAAALVFAPYFFSAVPESMGLILSFATVGVSFLFRPLGAAVAGHYGDRLGRKAMLVLTLMLMGGATALIGLLPSAATIGIWAPVLLVLLRIVQGFSAGGEWGGAALMAVEHAPADKRGKFGAFPQVGVPLGMLLATGFLAMLSVLLTEEQFVSWGWRVPFLFSIVLIGIGMWIRLGVTESPVFQERDGAGGHLHHPRPHRWAPRQGRPRPAQAGRLVHPLPEDLARSLSSSKGPGLVEGVGQSEGCPARRTDVPGTTVSSCGHEAPAGCPPGYPSRTALTIERFVVAESKSELVYTDLRRRIVHGEFTAGYRLVLARLAAHYGVSPVPVREALRRLEAEGLLRYTRNVGAEVVGVNQGDYAETMQVLAFLEGAATALAAPLLDADALERARRINAEMSRVREEDLDAVLFTTLNHEFHEVICAPCPNEHLSDLLGRERDRIAQVRRSSFTYVPERSLTSVEEHENILQLIASGAPAREVELAARDHKLRTMNQFLDARGVKPAVAAR